MRKILLLAVSFVMFGCSLHQDEKLGIVNGKSIYESDLKKRLGLEDIAIEQSNLEQKKIWFEEIVKQVSLEDESRRSKMDSQRLMKFLGVIDQVEVSQQERASYFERFPDFRARPQSEADAAIKTERRNKVEAKYKQEVLDKTARRFTATEQKRSKVQKFWSKLSF